MIANLYRIERGQARQLILALDEHDARDSSPLTGHGSLSATLLGRVWLDGDSLQGITSYQFLETGYPSDYGQGAVISDGLLDELDVGLSSMLTGVQAPC